MSLMVLKYQISTLLKFNSYIQMCSHPEDQPSNAETLTNLNFLKSEVLAEELNHIVKYNQSACYSDSLLSICHITKHNISQK